MPFAGFAHAVSRSPLKRLEPTLNTQTHDLYGVPIRSEIPLRAPASENSSFAVEAVWGERRPVPMEPPGGEVVASFFFGPDFGYTHAADPAGYTFRYHQVGDFRLDRQLQSIRVHLAPETDPEYAALLLEGNVIAALLMLSGECVLHASAVEVGGRAVAFIGHSGGGKSTLAALACAAGARLVTDDLLRVALREHDVHCYRGLETVRLRPGAASVLAHKSDVNLHRTADDRRLLEMKPSSDACPPLAAIIIPRLSRTASTLQMSLLPAAKSIYELSAFLRVIGWRNREVIARQFHLLGQLAKHVPVCEAVVPWGPPFPPDLGTRLLECATSVAQHKVVPA